MWIFKKDLQDILNAFSKVQEDLQEFIKDTEEEQADINLQKKILENKHDFLGFQAADAAALIKKLGD